MNRNANSGAKLKKAAKDREKRKSQLEQQPPTITVIEKNNLSPSKEVCYTRQYAGLSGDSIALYAEQTSEERLTEDVCDRLAEDINYKLRQIIHTAMVKARLSGRSAIQATDIEETFRSLNVDKVYGAPANPEFIPFGDEGLYYLNDTKINLIETAEQEITYIQPGDAKIERRWVLMDEEASEEAREECFRIVCESLLGSERTEQLAALDFLESECYIGSIIDWFYNFAYILLNDYFSCERLVVCAYSLIERLEGNPITDTSVSERQLNVLAHLLLEKVFLLPVNSNFLRYTCTLLALLCQRNLLREAIFEVLNEKAAEIKETHPLAFLILIDSMGIDAVKEFFLPFIDDFFSKSQEDFNLKFELLGIYNVIFKERLEDSDILYKKFYEQFEKTMLLFPFPQQQIEDRIKDEKATGFDAFFLSMIEQKTSITMAVNLIKTRRKLPISGDTSKKLDVNSAFKCDEVERKFNFRGNSIRNENIREKAERIYKERKNCFGARKSCILVGRTTLLASVFKNVQYESKKSKCCDHSLRSFNL